MLRRACAARPRRQALGERQSAAGRARVSAGCDVRKDGRARAAIPPSGHVLASCRGIFKTARAQIAALLDLFAQHGACQSIEFLALLELRQNRVQQLFEDRNRAVAGQDPRIGNDRLDELADELMQDCLADLVFALAVALRCGDELREFRSIDDLLSDEGSRRAAGNALRTRFRPIEPYGLYATVVHPRADCPFRAPFTYDRPAPGPVEVYGYYRVDCDSGQAWASDSARRRGANWHG